MATPDKTEAERRQEVFWFMLRRGRELTDQEIDEILRRQDEQNRPRPGPQAWDQQPWAVWLGGCIGFLLMMLGLFLLGSLFPVLPVGPR